MPAEWRLGQEDAQQASDVYEPPRLTDWVPECPMPTRSFGVAQVGSPPILDCLHPNYRQHIALRGPAWPCSVCTRSALHRGGAATRMRLGVGAACPRCVALCFCNLCRYRKLTNPPGKARMDALCVAMMRSPCWFSWRFCMSRLGGTALPSSTRGSRLLQRADSRHDMAAVATLGRCDHLRGHLRLCRDTFSIVLRAIGVVVRESDAGRYCRCLSHM